MDTTAYDVLLGMEFMTAVGGAYDTYTEKFKYRWTGSDGLAHSHEISAPCHVASPPLIAYACFSVLLNGEAELQDVQDSDDKVIPLEEEFGFRSSPLQLAAVNLQRLSEACN